MFPKNVCRICKNHLDDINLFIENCKSSDAFLKKIYMQEETITDLYDSDNCSFVQHDHESLNKIPNEIAKKNNLVPESLKGESKTTPRLAKLNQRQCSTCGDRINQGGVKKHYRLNPNCRPKDCKCPICEKSFYPKNKLIIHLRSHQKNMPYKCPECSKKFTFAENLRRHALTHTGVKPFICEICEKGNFIMGKTNNLILGVSICRLFKEKITR